MKEGLATVAHSLMMPFGLLRSRHQPERKKDIRTVVFVHGLGANRANFFPLQTYLKAKGYTRQLAFNYRSTGSIEGMAIRLRNEIKAQVKGGRIDIIAHSMGGLVSRYYVQQLGGSRRVDRLITLGTPHRGTYASMFVPSALVTQMKPEGPFIRHLEGLTPPAVRVLSLAAADDLLITPRSSALCSFGDSIMLEDLGHLGLLLSPKVFGIVARALEDPALT